MKYTYAIHYVTYSIELLNSFYFSEHPVEADLEDTSFERDPIDISLTLYVRNIYTTYY